MKRYICKKCNDLECETSICHNCGSKTEIAQKNIYWCENCNIPIFNNVCTLCNSKGKRIGSDLRLVFPEERLLLEVLMDVPFKYKNSSIWNVGANHYVIDGNKISFKYTELRKRNSEEIIKSLIQYQAENEELVNNFLNSETIYKFIEANRNRLNEITFEATNYIKEIVKDKNDDEIFCSFSGGKDSTVVSDLVLNALPNRQIIHIYGDTTLEFPETLKYVKRYKQRNNKIPMIVAKNKDQDFFDMCNVVGPPARMLRWCCTVFKTGAITKKIESTFKDKKKIISFQGIRRNESASRSKYDRESTTSKITKQHVASPIIDWMDFDVWLYLISNRLDFNDAYRLGYSRVGCWCCPNNSGWSDYLNSIYMNDEYKKFREILYTFAKKVGKKDWYDYIEDGFWKARQGGEGLEESKNTIISFKPCSNEENSYNFDLTKPINNELYKFFSPFGKINYDIGKKLLNEVYIIDKKTNNPLLKLSGRIGSQLLKITVLNESGIFKNKQKTEKMLKNQVNKFQTCIGCTYCQAVCKFNALKVFNTEKGNLSRETISYTIDIDKCVGCLECVMHFDNGCYMSKVLKVRKGE